MDEEHWTEDVYARGADNRHFQRLRAVNGSKPQPVDHFMGIKSDDSGHQGRPCFSPACSFSAKNTGIESQKKCPISPVAIFHRNRSGSIPSPLRSV